MGVGVKEGQLMTMEAIGVGLLGKHYVERVVGTKVEGVQCWFLEDEN